MSATDSVGKFPFRYFLGTFFFWFSQYIYVPILSPYLKDLGFSLSTIGIILSSYGVSQFFLRIPLGFWSDRGKIFKPFILTGVICTGLSCLGFALFPYPFTSFLARMLSGVGASFWVIITVFFASSFSKEESSKAMGQLTFCMSGGLLISTILGGWIVEQFGFQASFWVGVFGSLISLFAFSGVTEKVEVKKPKISFGEGLRVNSSPALIMISSAGAVLHFNSFATTYGFVPLLAVQLGSSKTQLGIITALNLSSYSIASLFVGTKLLKRVSERLVVIIGFLLVAITSLTLPLVSSLPLLYLNQIIHGLGRGFVYSILMGLVFKLAPSDERATAMGIYQSIYSLGILAGPLIGGWVGTFWGIDGIFIVSGACTFIAIPIFWRIRIGKGRA